MDANTNSPPPSPPSKEGAKVIARRAVDLLVIGCVGAVAISTGRQFHQWWSAEEASPSLATSDVGAEWMSRPLDLTIGPAGVALHREPFAGTREEAERRLIELARKHCPTKLNEDVPVDDAERDLLESLQRITPVEQSTYVLSTPMPAVTLTSRDANANPAERLIGQAFAMPAGEQQWTLFVLPRGRNATPSPPVPASMSVLLSWSDPLGNSVCAVHGDGPLERATKAFDELYGHDRAVIRNVSADEVTLRYQPDHQVIDVRLQTDGPRGWHGVVWTSPSKAPSP